MSTFRLQKVDNLDRPPKTLLLYEDDGNRVRHHRYVCPVRCVDCKHSYNIRFKGELKRVCHYRLDFCEENGFCDRGERR